MKVSYRKIQTSFLLVLAISLSSFAQNKDDVLGYKGSLFWSESKKPIFYLDRSIAAESQINWISGNHTSSPVPLGAIGPEKYTSRLRGIISNTDIAPVLKDALSDGINVILVIGDGMGSTQMTLPSYINYALGNNESTYFEKITREGSTAFVLTNPAGGLVTESAAAGTAIAGGEKARMYMVGMNYKGYPTKSILKHAEKLGKKTGLISDAEIVDATPGGFYGSTIDRKNKSLIASQMIDSVEIEVVFGGGAQWFIPEGSILQDYPEFQDYKVYSRSESARDDNRDIISEFRDKNYKVINTSDELKQITSSDKKVLGLFSPGGLNSTINRDDEDTGEPGLDLCSMKALDILSSGGEGFFLMTECSGSDWEGHNNDAGAVYKAVLELDRILKIYYDYQRKNPEKTLLVFTADHETGGIAFTYQGMPEKDRFDETLESGLTYHNKIDPLFFEQFIKLKDQKKSLPWIFNTAKTSDELRTMLDENMSYKLTEKEVEVLFKIINKQKFEIED